MRGSSKVAGQQQDQSIAGVTLASCRLISHLRLTAAKKLHVAGAYWLSVDGTDRWTDKHRTILRCLPHIVCGLCNN